MTVYVDNARIPLGRMLMCHMLADTRQELEAMVLEIGLPKSATIQNEGQPNEHYDLSLIYREKAIAAGAKELDSRGLVKIIRKKRLSPEEAAVEVALPMDDPRRDVHTPPAPEDIPDMDEDAVPEKPKLNRVVIKPKTMRGKKSR